MRIILDILSLGLFIAAGSYILRYVLHYVAKDEADTTFRTSLRISIGVTIAYTTVALYFGRLGFVLAVIPVTSFTLVDLIKHAWVPERRVARVALVFMSVYLFVVIAVQSLVGVLLPGRVSMVGIVPHYLSTLFENEALANQGRLSREVRLSTLEFPGIDQANTNEAVGVQMMLSEYLNANVDIDQVVQMLDGSLEPSYFGDGLLLPVLTPPDISETNTVIEIPMAVKESESAAIATAATKEPLSGQGRKKESRLEADTGKDTLEAKAKFLDDILAMDPAGWRSTRAQLIDRLRSVYSMNGVHLAILNDEMMWQGKLVSIEHGGKHFIWTLANLSMNELEWQPVGIADTKPTLRNKFPQAAKD